MILLLNISSWLDAHMIPCFVKQHFGIECPGCAMQRSLMLLLQGNLVESVRRYPALIPMLTMLAFLIAHLIFRFRNGAAILKISFFSTVSIMWIHYLVKIFS